MKQPAVYIMTSTKNGTLYIGVTSSLFHRIYQHKHGIFKGYTKKYGCKLFVYYELHASMPEAIAREKNIKGYTRAKKITLIESMNPDWDDLYPLVYRGA